MQGAEPIAIQEIRASAYTIPTDHPEADGTLSWTSTTLVLVELEAGGECGLGFSYTGAAAVDVIRDHLAEVVRGRDALAIPACWEAMRHAIRNLGRPGVVSAALSAVDFALWDLKARLLGISLTTLLGPVRGAMPLYGSGGFTSYSVDLLTRQLGGWAEQGFERVKMKIGADPGVDLERIRAARRAIGPEVQLFIDANGAFQRKEALALAEAAAEAGVVWFEEPVSSDDLGGLKLLRNRVPAGMQVAAGEYGYDLFYFRRMLDAGAVDCLQVDGTRCGGISEFLRAGALCAAHPLPLSAHTAPVLHLHPCLALAPAVHLEYFHDHVRIENLLFDGVPQPRGGMLVAHRDAPGLGLTLRRSDAEPYRIR